MTLRGVVAGTLVALVGCSGEAPQDQDKKLDVGVYDAGADTSADDTAAPDDTAAADDTGSPDTGSSDTGPADTGPSDTGLDADAKPTRLVCPGEEFEPNDSRPTASTLKDINDCDGSGSSFSGIAAGSTDPDWWSFKGSDTFGCVVDATAVSASAGIRVCIFARCIDGSTAFKSCKKGTPITLSGGEQGCCGEGGANAQIEHSCTLVGTDDSATVSMRVDAPGATTCTPYKVDYHF
ncbi:MAG: hypothetical protein JNL79_09475 [Myxococcales bacterium]|nr:hypothetical protein [Myxococcales bacterium]